MSRSLLTYLVVPVFFVVSALSFASPASGQQCGINFQSEYRAVDKIRRFTQNGGTFRLQDWTGDGRSDFWNFRFNTTTQTSDIIIYPALATGYWDWDNPIIYTTTLNSSASTDPGCCFAYQFRDFDSDGKLDMLLKSWGYPDHKIHRNMGNGTFVPLATLVSPADSNHWMRYIGYADVNSDGRLDWVYTLEVIATGHETFYYSPLNADGSLGSPVLILAHTAENGINDSTRFLGDFDGDGDDDIAYKSFASGSYQIRILRNMGNGTFTLGTPLTINSVFIFGVGELNNDGRMDIYADGGSGLVVFSGQSDATFTVATYPFTITNSTAFVRNPVDFNGDGRLDLINVDYTDYEIFLSNPAGGFFPSQYYPRILSYPTPSLYIEDFNADGKADLYDRPHEIFNTFGEEVVVIKSNVCDFKGQTRAMNFDSIPIPDIVSWNGANGQWRFGNGNWNPTANIPSQTYNWGSSALGDIPAPGDFDGDGRTDYAVYRNSEGKWYVDLSSTAAWTEFNFGLPGDIPIPNDYNGGGKTDYAVFRPSDGNWYIFYMETLQVVAVHWGANGDRPVPADFDGDTKTDIAVFRQATGDWYYIRSSDQGLGIFHWGTTGDLALPADYDGDGKADLAVYRSGVWHILRSTNGSYAPIYWGTTGDIPLPFLEKGEVSRPVVYRPSDSRWYSYRYQIGWSLPLGGGTPVYFGLPN
ncbi:MAG: VCBS repeat-containing protein [Pyrinomonadaceae bacterium]|nr:VCBS repeat-containing protein [Pyrinomonadaceae bacterium]